MKDLKKIIKEKSEENGTLSKELEELNVAVNERRHIHEVNGKCTRRINWCSCPMYIMEKSDGVVWSCGIMLD